MIPHQDFEARLRAELHAADAEPRADFRERLSQRLDDTAGGSNFTAPEPDDSLDGSAPTTANLPHRRVWAAAALAAGLLAVVAVRVTATAESPAAPNLDEADPSQWTASLDVSASQWETDLSLQGDRMADDARRAALDLFGRLPAAPWARRTDR